VTQEYQSAKQTVVTPLPKIRMTDSTGQMTWVDDREYFPEMNYDSKQVHIGVARFLEPLSLAPKKVTFSKRSTQTVVYQQLSTHFSDAQKQTTFHLEVVSEVSIVKSSFVIQSNPFIRPSSPVQKARRINL
jgi:hypothetical protein